MVELHINFHHVMKLAGGEICEYCTVHEVDWSAGWDFAISTNTDVITVSDTWLNTTITNSKIGIDGYKLYRAISLSPWGLKQQRSWWPCWYAFQKNILKFFCLGTPTWRS